MFTNVTFIDLTNKSKQNWLGGVKVDSLITQNVEMNGWVSHAVFPEHGDAAVEAPSCRFVVVKQITAQQDEIDLKRKRKKWPWDVIYFLDSHLNVNDMACTWLVLAQFRISFSVLYESLPRMASFSK